MAVSVKKIKPVKADISSSLSMLTERKFEQITQDESKIQTEKQEKEHSREISKKITTKDTQIVFRTTEENKNSLKSFFAERGLTLSKGIQLACLYFEQQIRTGGVVVSSSGLIASKDGR